jgi:dihydroxyacetone kinase DhaKLM complex PTS-EIIA-like component DhaM
VHVSNTARAVWTQWFEDQRDRLRRVHVLTASRYMHLAVSMSRHESRTSIEVHADAAAFAAAMRSAAPAWKADADQALAARAVPIRRVDGPGLVILDDGACSYTFRRPARDVLLLALAGVDRGVLASEAFDETARARDEAGRLHVFVDLRAAQMPALLVSDLWSQWFAASRAALASVVVLAPASPVYVTASIAHLRSQTGALMRVVEDAARFEAALRRVAPGYA